MKWNGRSWKLSFGSEPEGGRTKPMKTVKQIADEIGVSKQAVFKKIDKLGLRQQLTKVNNQCLIDENAEKKIKKAFPKAEKTETGSLAVNMLIDALKAELKAKNEQIAALQRLLDQQQQLNAIAEQKIRFLEEKKEEPQEAQNQEPEAKETFWSRFWHKGN